MVLHLPSHHVVGAQSVRDRGDDDALHCNCFHSLVDSRLVVSYNIAVRSAASQTSWSLICLSSSTKNKPQQR